MSDFVAKFLLIWVFFNLNLIDMVKIVDYREIIERQLNSPNSENQLLGLFVGENNRSYYLRVFDEIEQFGGYSFNLWAALLTSFWLLYRKMYLYFVGYVLVNYVIGFIYKSFVGLIFTGSCSGAYCGYSMSGFFYTVIASLVCGMFANALYLRRAKAVIADSVDKENPYAYIKSKGGTSYRGILWIFVFSVVIGFFVAIF
ncbi:DUF2628 domain-containing protein [Lampropedia aestuarii]|uniref:DUF2628 domain-containing protein n=1 Tax=Lampropedia aestuarii TaxID=2562762 RepID=UPI002468F7FC|nr:DUF2628 domain-containing protein [Lampropedia aestuarii]MDH5858592.1 DUF2628 domain-containing protein [Lampropedia aestuarii]